MIGLAALRDRTVAHIAIAVWKNAQTCLMKKANQYRRGIMGRLKSYYHEQIVEKMEEPGPEQDPEEQWWSEQDKDTTWIAEQGDYMPEDNGEERSDDG